MKHYLIGIERGIHNENPESNVWVSYIGVYADSREQAIKIAEKITGREDLSKSEIIEPKNS